MSIRLHHVRSTDTHLKLNLSNSSKTDHDMKHRQDKEIRIPQELSDVLYFLPMTVHAPQVILIQDHALNP
jgi:hypothetical protein